MLFRPTYKQKIMTVENRLKLPRNVENRLLCKKEMRKHVLLLHYTKCNREQKSEELRTYLERVPISNASYNTSTKKATRNWKQSTIK